MNDELAPGRFFGRTARHTILPGIRLSENVYRKTSVTPSHAHSNPHFCFVLSGHYSETILNRTYLRSDSTLLFLPASVEHTETHFSPVRSFLVEIDAWRMATLPVKNTKMTEPFAVDSHQAHGSMAKLHQQFLKPETYSALSLETTALQSIESVFCRAGTVRIRRRPKWLDRVKQILQDECENPPTLSEIGIEIGINPCHVARVFRLHMGVAIGQYVRVIRVNRAKSLLENTDVPLVEVAIRCGFVDQSHFSNSFKLVTGCTPLNYRRANQQSMPNNQA